MRPFRIVLASLTFFVLVLSFVSNQTDAQDDRRPRVREAGIVVGVLPPGSLNAITDVSGVTVGHSTIVRGDNVRTGVTAILPHGGNLFREDRKSTRLNSSHRGSSYAVLWW